MRFEYTPALALALERASSYARRRSLTAIAPVHLLHGLLVEEEGRAAVLLTGAGVPWAVLRDRLDLANPAADPEPVSVDAATRHILAGARQLAVLHSEEGTLSSDQVLLALLREEPALRGELEALGLDFARLEGEIDPVRPPLAFDVGLDLAEPTDQTAAARVLDASANRAREAVRVLEDYCRFVLDDAFLSRQLKQLRHDLTAALAGLPPGLLLDARDTAHDVGTAIDTAQEWQRGSVGAVVAANAKRLQEALRSLEEFGKIFSADVARAVEQVRYATYTIERALVLAQPGRDRLADARLYVLVTESLCRTSLVGTVREACLGGAQVIQLREKQLDDRRLLDLAREVRAITRAHGVLFIVNDRPDIALLAEADGVHLGQDDLPVRAARRILGPDALVGVSTHTVEQVRAAVLEGASYLGVGPTFASKTKGFDALAGLEFVRRAAAETSLPAFVLGGVNLGNVGQVLAAGGRRVAVSHAACAAEDPKWVAGEFRRLLAPAR
jgi:thiamine-phosphate pyrophosphorylase